MADLTGCQTASPLLTDERALLGVCLEAVHASGLSAVGQLAVRFPLNEDGSGGGVTATVLLAESHLCVHTWPEHAAVTMDVYVCNRSADHSGKAKNLLNQLILLFGAEQIESQCLQRGQAGFSSPGQA